MAACLSNPSVQIHFCIPCQINIAKQIIKLFHFFIFGAGNAPPTASKPFAERARSILVVRKQQANQSAAARNMHALYVLLATLLATYQEIHQASITTSIALHGS
jgi:hypothetical protein